jgi:hypothetical protein
MGPRLITGGDSLGWWNELTSIRSPPIVFSLAYEWLEDTPKRQISFEGVQSTDTL